MRHKLFKNDTKKSKNITRYGCLKATLTARPVNASLVKRLVNPFLMAREVTPIRAAGGASQLPPIRIHATARL